MKRLCISVLLFLDNDRITNTGMGGTTMMILCRDHERAVAVVKNVDDDTSTSHLFLALQMLDEFHNK